MPKVFIKINKQSDLYPYEAVKAGAEAYGLTHCSHEQLKSATKEDILITWTLWNHTSKRRVADQHMSRNGRVICMENGFIRKINGKRYFQFSLRQGNGSGINGSGLFNIGDSSRWHSWDIQLKDWNEGGDYILVCPQRGVVTGDPHITHGPRWSQEIYDKIRKYTDKPIFWRPHPGAPNRATLPKGNICVLNPEDTLEEQLENAYCTVVYSSTAANESLLNGVPVFFDAPNIICQRLCGKVERINKPIRRDRDKVYEKLAWAQWNEDELASGEAFETLLR